MNSDTLSEIIASRLEDFVERYDHLVKHGLYEEAKLIAKEGHLIAQAHDNADLFLVVRDLNVNNV